MSRKLKFKDKRFIDRVKKDLQQYNIDNNTSLGEAEFLLLRGGLSGAYINTVVVLDMYNEYKIAYPNLKKWARLELIEDQLNISSVQINNILKNSGRKRTF